MMMSGKLKCPKCGYECDDVVLVWGRQPYNRELRKTLRGAYDKLLRAMNL